MTEKVRDLRLRLEAIIAAAEAESSDRASNSAIHKMVGILADHDDMSIVDFFRRLRGAPQRPVTTAAGGAVDLPEIISRLKSALPSDDAFHHALDALARKRSVTKSVLTEIFYGLFERTQGVPKKATRAELLRLIEDERNIVVGNLKMREMLRRHAVPAE